VRWYLDPTCRILAILSLGSRDCNETHASARSAGDSTFAGGTHLDDVKAVAQTDAKIAIAV
jgi:hypothetical protein